MLDNQKHLPDKSGLMLGAITALAGVAWLGCGLATWRAPHEVALVAALAGVAGTVTVCAVIGWTRQGVERAGTQHREKILTAISEYRTAVDETTLEIKGSVSAMIARNAAATEQLHKQVQAMAAELERYYWIAYANGATSANGEDTNGDVVQIRNRAKT